MCVFRELCITLNRLGRGLYLPPRTSFLFLFVFFPSCLSSSWNCITPAENSNSGGREGSKPPGLLHLKRLFNPRLYIVLPVCVSSRLQPIGSDKKKKQTEKSYVSSVKNISLDLSSHGTVYKLLSPAFT